MNEFLPKVAEIPEVDSVTPDFKFRKIDEAVDSRHPLWWSN